MSRRIPFTSLHQAVSQDDTLRLNRRDHPRENAGELAELIIDITGRTIACLVHNVSDGGVMVETSVNLLPKRVILNYQEKNIRKVCKLVWSTDNLAGLQFV